MSDHRTFLEACLAGDASIDDLEDWIDRWHDSDVPDETLKLEEFLGFSSEEWQRWLRNPSALEAIVTSHRPNLPKLHVIFTDHGESGWSIESPQLPDLVGGRPTLKQLLVEASEILQFAGAEITRLDSPQIAVHEQHLLRDPEGREYLVRWQTDGENLDARVATAERIAGAIAEGFDDDERARHPQLAAGECLMVACVGSDTVGWTVGQLGADGRAVLAEAQGEVVWYLPFGQNLGHPEGTEINDIGLRFDSTFSEMSGATLAAEVSRLAYTQSAGSLHIERGMTHF